MGIPTDDVPPSDEVRSFEEIGAENVKLRRLVEFQAERIAELEKLIEEVRRGGKRQAAPFSKGITKPNPKRPGRKGGGDYGTKARRALPDPSVNRTGCFWPRFPQRVRTAPAPS